MWRTKDLLGLEEHSADEILGILDTAEAMKDIIHRDIKKVPTLRGKSMVKGESLIETGRPLEAMGTDLIVIRHSAAGAPHLLARSVKSRVVNAGDGMHEHPTQGLLDLYTMRQKKGNLANLKVAILGDVMHSRVARSNIWGLS